MTIESAEIAAMIPHAGRMSLIERALDWTPSHILCSTTTHRTSDNPLARDGALPVLAGLEYAAQAMALHGRLSRSADGPVRGGVIASVRDLAWSVERLDDIPEALRIEVEKFAGDGTTMLYAFRVTAGTRALISGRATVVLGAEAT
jgi:predicted hotdog family 3-hydroxylacyl-ACP dehydratase